jgi:hypothetical protein
MGKDGVWVENFCRGGSVCNHLELRCEVRKSPLEVVGSIAWRGFHRLENLRIQSWEMLRTLGLCNLNI